MEQILLRGIKTSKMRRERTAEWECNVEGTRLEPLDFAALKTNAPFADPLPVQKTVMPYFLEGVNVAVRSFTGSGKTLAYCLPLAEIARREWMFGLVLVPTKALVRQVFRVINEIRSKRLDTAAVYRQDGEALWLSENEKGTISETNCGCLSDSKRTVLVATPEALLDISSHIEWKRVSHVVVDEADFLVETPAFASILGCLERERLHFSCFSATTSREVEEMLGTFKDVTRICVRLSRAVSHEFVFGTDERIKHMALQQVIANGIEAPALIFVKDRETGERLSALVDRSAVYSEDSANSILDDFRMKKIWYLFTTDALGRGVDFYSVRCVVNYDIPATKTQFVHRAGRVNRNSQGQRIFTIYTAADFRKIGMVVEFLDENSCFIPEHIRRIAERSRD